MNTAIKYALLLCVCCCFGKASAAELEVLLEQLKAAREDTAKVSLLLDIEMAYSAKDPDSAMYYLNQARKLVHKLNDTTNEYRCYFEYVVLYHAKFDNQKALEYCLKTIDIAQKRNNKQQEAKSYRALFNIYHNLREYDLAVKYAMHSRKLSESIGDTLNIAINYGNLCWLYMDLGQYKKAVYYGEKGIEAGKRYRDIKGWLISINNTALAYRNLNDNKKAEELFKQQLEIAYKENIPRSIHKGLANLCIMYYNIGDRDNLARYTQEYNNYVTSSNVRIGPKDQCYGYIVNAYNYIYNKQFSLAEEQILKGLEIAERDSIADPLMELYTAYSNLSYARHDFQKGQFYLNKYDSVSQAEFDDELSLYSMDLEAKYETAKKENKILKQQQQLQSRSVWIYILMGSVLLLVALSFLLYRYFAQRNALLSKEKIIREQRIQELEKEKQLEATEAILKGQEEERSRIAKDLHDGLGGMLSGVKYSLNNMKENVLLTPENALSFGRTLDMLDSGIQELRRIAHNMMPENLVKFGLDVALKDYCSAIAGSKSLQINYSSFGIDRLQLDTNVSVTVYRVIQELIGNVIKHAQATEVIVQLFRDEDKLHITVEDNGIGFDTQNIQSFKGAGWTNIQNRIAYLKGTIELESGKGTGTSVVIEIPLA